MWRRHENRVQMFHDRSRDKIARGQPRETSREWVLLTLTAACVILELLDMRAYSKDLRVKVLDAVDRGMPRAEVARIFGVSLPSIKRWLKRRRETGKVDPKPIPRPPAIKGGMLEEWLAGHLRSNPDLTLEEHCEAFEEELGITVSTATMSRSISRLPGGWPIKKVPRVASERDEELRRLWRWLASRFDAKRLVFIDKSGFHTSMMRLRARAPRGERAYGKVPIWLAHEAFRTVSLVLLR